MNLKLKPGQLPILIFNVILLIIFGSLFLYQERWEFIGYLIIIVLFMILIASTNDKVNYSNLVLWGLTIWLAMHFIGGGIEYIQPLTSKLAFSPKIMPLGLIKNRLALPLTPRVPKISDRLLPVTRLKILVIPSGLAK